MRGLVLWKGRCAVAGLLLASVAPAAQYTRAPLRSVQGTVRDKGDEPLRDAVVQLEAEDTLVIQSYVTDDRGLYHFRNLRPDADYKVWATFRGHHSSHHEIGKFDHKVDREIPLVIDLEKD